MDPRKLTVVHSTKRRCSGRGPLSGWGSVFLPHTGKDTQVQPAWLSDLDAPDP